MSEAATAHMRIEIMDGPPIRFNGDICDVFYTPWDSFLSVIEDYFDDQEGPVTLKIERVMLTDEQFETICETGEAP